jgi:hypothetical protein
MQEHVKSFLYLFHRLLLGLIAPGHVPSRPPFDKTRPSGIIHE